jgi:hypothetical protein
MEMTESSIDMSMTTQSATNTEPPTRSPSSFTIDENNEILEIYDQDKSNIQPPNSPREESIVNIALEIASCYFDGFRKTTILITSVAVLLLAVLSISLLLVELESSMFLTVIQVHSTVLMLLVLLFLVQNRRRRRKIHLQTEMGIFYLSVLRILIDLIEVFIVANVIYLIDRAIDKSNFSYWELVIPCMISGIGYSAIIYMLAEIIEKSKSILTVLWCIQTISGKFFFIKSSD